MLQTEKKLEESVVSEIYEAIYYGETQLLRKKLEEYPEVLTDPVRTPLLVVAIDQSHKEIVQMLIEEFGCTLDREFHSVDGQLHHNIMTFAAQFARVWMIRLLLSYDKCDVNWQNCYGETCLHIAYGRNEAESFYAVNVFLDAGANPAVRTKSGLVPHDYQITHSPKVQKNSDFIKNENGDNNGWVVAEDFKSNPETQTSQVQAEATGI